VPWLLSLTGHEVEYPCCPGKKYGDVTYSFRMRPRSTALREVRRRNLLPPPADSSPLTPPTNAEDSAVSSAFSTTTDSNHHRLPLFFACVTWFGHVI